MKIKRGVETAIVLVFCFVMLLSFGAEEKGHAADLYRENVHSLPDEAGHFRGDFSAGEFPNLWSYLWNAPEGWSAAEGGDLQSAPLGEPGTYVELVSTPDGWSAAQAIDPSNPVGTGVMITSTGGLSGEAAVGENLFRRYSIAAFEVPQDGYYALGESFLRSAPGTAVEALVHINDESPVRGVVSEGEDKSFDINLDFLYAGDMIYVCFGPAGFGGELFEADFKLFRVENNLQGIVDSKLETGADTVVIPPGYYRTRAESGAAGDAHLTIHDLEDRTIIMDDVYMVCTDHKTAVYLLRNARTHIKGLTVDYSPLPFTQFEITGIDKGDNSYTMELIYGYTIENLRDGDWHTWVMDPDTETLRVLRGLGGANFGLEAVGPKTYRYRVHPSLEMSEQVGDIVIVNNIKDDDTRTSVIIGQSDGLTVDDFRIYSSPHMAIFAGSNEGVTYRNIVIDRCPPEEDYRHRDSGRFRSSNRDGFHLHCDRGEVLVENVTAKYCDDDGLNVHGKSNIIQDVSGRRITVVDAGGNLYARQGELADFVTFAGIRAGTAVVTAISSGEDPSEEFLDWYDSYSGTGYVKLHPRLRPTRTWVLELDREVPEAGMGTMVFHEGRAGRGIVIRDSEFGWNRSRGILMRSSDALIENNTIKTWFDPAIVLTGSFRSMEVGFPGNVLISGNKISSQRHEAVRVGYALPDEEPPPMGLYKDISIINNEIYGGPDYDVIFWGLDGWLLEDNTFSNGPRIQSVNSRSVDELAAGFEADRVFGRPGDDIQFTDLSRGNPINWHWDFGDGNTSDQQHPAHSYQETGVYTVSLTVEDDEDQSTDTRLEYINIILSGSEMWRLPTDGIVLSSPAVGPCGTVFVGSEDGRLFAVNPADGKPVWSARTSGAVHSSPAIGKDGNVYAGSWDGRVYAFDSSQGVLRWRFKTDGRVQSSPSIGRDGTVYVGSADRRLYALNPEDGSEKWSFRTGSTVFSSPAIGSDGTVYAGSWDYNLYALDPEWGEKKWQFETGGRIYSSPAIAGDGTVYFGSWDGNIYAVNPSDGSLKWSYNTGDSIYSSPALGEDGTVYVGSRNGRIFALDPSDGRRIWSLNTGSMINSSPAAGDDGTLYIGSGDGRLYAVSGEGNKLWSFETGKSMDSSPVISEYGFVFAGSQDGSLYAILSSSDGPAESFWPMFGQNMRRTGRVDAEDDRPPLSGIQEKIEQAVKEGLNTVVIQGDHILEAPVIISADDFTVRSAGGYKNTGIDAGGLDEAFIIEGKNVTVEGFWVTNFKEAGFDIRGENASIVNNLIDGFRVGESGGSGNALYGVYVCAEGAGVYGNIIENNGIAIAVCSFASGVIIANNTITENIVAGIWYVGDSSPEDATALNNNISGNAAGVIWDGAELMARHNWWGEDNGPDHPDNPDGRGDTVEGDVVFDPWLGAESKGTGSGAIAGCGELALDARRGVAVLPEGGKVFATMIEYLPSETPKSGPEAHYFELRVIEDDGITEISIYLGYKEPVEKAVYWLDRRDGNATWHKCCDEISVWDPEGKQNPFSDAGYDGFVEVTVDTSDLTRPFYPDDFSSSILLSTAASEDEERDDGRVVVRAESGSSSCFIATAAYGTHISEEVGVLYGLRDELVLYEAGRYLVNMYYRLSPPLAGLISRSEAARGALRHALRPLARFASEFSDE